MPKIGDIQEIEGVNYGGEPESWYEIYTGEKWMGKAFTFKKACKVAEHLKRGVSHYTISREKSELLRRKPFLTGMTLCKTIEPKRYSGVTIISSKDIKKACKDIPDTFFCEAMGTKKSFRVPNDKFEGYALLIRAKKYVEAMEYVDEHGVDL